MTPWLRRTIGPGRNRSAAPTQPLEDTPAAAHVIGWLPSDALADAMARNPYSNAPTPIPGARAGKQDDSAHWEAVAKYSIVFLVGMLIGAVLAS